MVLPDYCVPKSRLLRGNPESEDIVFISTGIVKQFLACED